MSKFFKKVGLYIASLLLLIAGLYLAYNLVIVWLEKLKHDIYVVIGIVLVIALVYLRNKFKAT